MGHDWHASLVHILDGSVRSVVLAAGVAAILFVVRVRSSALRHAVWTGVLLGMLAMPLLTWLLPPVTLSFVGMPPGFERMLQPYGAARPDSRSRLPGEPRVVMTGPPGGSAADAGDEPGFPWLVVTLVVYGLGAGALLLRMAIGWRARVRLLRSSRTDVTPDRVVVCESGALATPVTCGIFDPVIILPREWPSWPPAKRQAVLAHEQAHVRRRDPVVAFIAHVNCVLFWWHPLAWWLNRTISATAEQACDEAVVRATGDMDGYAATLVEMAEAVRARGKRPDWQGLGISGAGLLHRRIEWLLQGSPPRRVPVPWQLTVAALCLSAAWLSAAAHVPSPAAGRTIGIRSAIFGATGGAADVTPIVTHLLGSADVFYAAPAWLEVDPAIGERKRLVILYAYGGSEHVFTSGEPGPISRALLVQHAAPSGEQPSPPRVPASGSPRDGLEMIAAHYGQGQSYTPVTTRIRELIHPNGDPFVVDDATFGIRPGPPVKTLIVTYSFEGRYATLLARAGSEIGYARLVAHAASSEPHLRATSERPAWLASVRILPPRQPGDHGPGYGQSPRKELAIVRLAEAHAELDALPSGEHDEAVSRAVAFITQALGDARLDIAYPYPRPGSGPLLAPVEPRTTAERITTSSQSLTMALHYLRGSSARPRSAAYRAGAIDAIERALAELRTIWDAEGAHENTGRGSRS